MTHPRDWPSTRYFLIGLFLGALVAYASIAMLDLPRWAQFSIALVVPSAIGLLAMVVREEIFFWFVS